MPTIQRHVEAKHTDMRFRQFALRVRAEEQDSGICESLVAGNGTDVAEQIMNRPFVRSRVEKHLPEFFDDAGIEVLFGICRAWRPFEVDDALVPLDLFPLQSRQRKVLRSAPDPRARIRPHGLAYCAFRIRVWAHAS